jgi:hypothetical protein
MLKGFLNVVHAFELNVNIVHTDGERDVQDLLDWIILNCLSFGPHRFRAHRHPRSRPAELVARRSAPASKLTQRRFRPTDRRDKPPSCGRRHVHEIM